MGADSPLRFKFKKIPCKFPSFRETTLERGSLETASTATQSVLCRVVPAMCGISPGFRGSGGRARAGYWATASMSASTPMPTVIGQETW